MTSLTPDRTALITAAIDKALTEAGARVSTILRGRVPQQRLMKNPHQGYALLTQEVDKLWIAIKMPDMHYAFEQSERIAAVAIRFLVDLRGEVTEEIAVEQIRREVLRAMTKWPHGFDDAYEGYAVLLEEVDEVWDAVKADNYQHAFDEMIQVAAMAIRFTVDLGEGL